VQDQDMAKEEESKDDWDHVLCSRLVLRGCEGLAWKARGKYRTTRSVRVT
jgi:hypothetical protein